MNTDTSILAKAIYGENSPEHLATLQASPRKKHSHRCPRCHNTVYCYKGGCTLPQKLTSACKYCRP